MLSSSLVSLFLVATVLVNAEIDIDEELHFLAPHPLLAEGVDQDVNSLGSDMLGHYGKPPSDCLPDEMAFQISGVPGVVRVAVKTRG